MIEYNPSTFDRAASSNERQATRIEISIHIRFSTPSITIYGKCNKKLFVTLFPNFANAQVCHSRARSKIEQRIDSGT